MIAVRLEGIPNFQFASLECGGSIAENLVGHPYLPVSNISNTGYQEIASVPMPGHSLVGGVEHLPPGADQGIVARRRRARHAPTELEGVPHSPAQNRDNS